MRTAERPLHNTGRDVQWQSESQGGFSRTKRAATYTERWVDLHLLLAEMSCIHVVTWHLHSLCTDGLG